MKNQTITAPVTSIEQAFTFRGERIAKVSGKVNLESALRFGVSLVNAGEQSKARGVFVIATKAAECKDEKEAETFATLLRAEFINSAVENTLALLPSDASDQAKTAAKLSAETEAKKRVDNLGQAVRAAKWMLANPDKVADSVSVFTVAQANAYTALEAPKAKEGQTAPEAAKVAEYEQKKAVQAAILPLLATPGTSQGAIKKAISEAKEKLAKEASEAAKAAEPVKTAEELAEAEKTKRERQLVTRAVTMLAAWDEAVTGGSKPEELRALLISPADKSQGTLADKVRQLATLAGWSTTAMK